MASFSIAYHESIRKSPRSAGDPVTLHWEQRMPSDKSFAGAKRYSVSKNHTKALDGDLFSLVGEPSSMLNRVFSQLKNDVCADGLRSIGVYTLLQGQNIPVVITQDAENGVLVTLKGGEIFTEMK